MKPYVLIIAILCAYIFVSNEDYKVAKAAEQERLTKTACAPTDYIGRPLVASYEAKSDTMQIKRCTYRRA